MNIYVGNLSWSMTDDDLSNLFSQYGTVTSAKILKEKNTGRSKGFGFVEMETAEGAEKAIHELNEKPFLERNLRVSLAQERTERSDRGGDRGGGGGDRGGDRGDRPMGGNREYRSSDRGDRNGNSQGQKPFRPRGPSRGN